MKKPIEIVVVFACCLLCSSAFAQGQGKTTAADLPQPVSSSELATMSGGESPKSITITNQTLSATNSGNTVNANSLVTGDISVPTSAFSGFNGVGNFVFNTGNNNNLQGNLSVTIVTP